MSKNKFKWVRQMEGMPYVDPDVVGNELEKIERRSKGKLKPHMIVMAASSKKSKLHKCFEWDDTKAAAKYRLTQAREMLRKIVFEYEDTKGETQTIRTFEHITKEGEAAGYYCHTGRIAKDPTLQKNVVDQILEELQAFRRKYDKYKDHPKLKKIWSAVDQAITGEP